MEVDQEFVPASLLLRPPQVKTTARQPSQRYEGIRSTKRFNWTARCTFPLTGQTATARDRFALLFAHLQQCDPGLQLLPFVVESTQNAITAAKNLPYDAALEEYLKLPDNQNHALGRRRHGPHDSFAVTYV